MLQGSLVRYFRPVWRPFWISAVTIPLRRPHLQDSGGPSLISLRRISTSGPSLSFASGGYPSSDHSNVVHSIAQGWHVLAESFKSLYLDKWRYSKLASPNNSSGIAWQVAQVVVVILVVVGVVVALLSNVQIQLPGNIHLLYTQWLADSASVHTI